MTMRLSTPIALGRVTIPEMKSARLDSCALGMALNAMGKSTKTASGGDNYPELRAMWPWLDICPATVQCCEFHPKSDSNLEAVYRVFDSHVMALYEDRRWSLDQLIDWVRSVEPAEQEELTPQVDVEQELVTAIAAIDRVLASV